MSVLQTIDLKKYYGTEPDITCALVTKPAIVPADELTGNLDRRTSAEVLGHIRRTSAEFRQTVVMITQNNDIARLADWIVRIEDGTIAGRGGASTERFWNAFRRNAARRKRGDST